MQKAMAQKEAVRAAKEKLRDATSEELSAYIREAFGLTIMPPIVSVLLCSFKEREYLDQVNRAVRDRMHTWQAENPEEAKKLAATAKRKEAASRRKAEAAEVSPTVAPDIITEAELPADDVSAKVSASLPTL